MKTLNIFSLRITWIVLTICLANCNRDVELSVETAEIIEVGHKTALAGGNVVSGENLTYRGLCWATHDQPTMYDDRHTAEGTTLTLTSIMGPFTHKMTSLYPATTYYYRSYLENTSGQVVYGRTYSFTTLPSRGTVTDVEGNIYQTAQIGDQLWMAENLKNTHYSNGDEIPTTDPDTLHLADLVTNDYQWAYDGDESIAGEYGRLYNWYAITDSRNVCPAGWHVPTDYEWQALFGYLGGDTLAVNRMKEEGTIHWVTDFDADNSSDFTALPGGYRFDNGDFSGLWETATFWSSLTDTQYGFYGYELLMYENHPVNQCWGNDANTAFSVRCIKD